MEGDQFCSQQKEDYQIFIQAFVIRFLKAVQTAFLVYIIERAKKCLDFSATIYIVHLFICIMYGGWPSSFTWWIVNIAGLAIMALLGEYLCIRRELQDIPINRYRPSQLEYPTPAFLDEPGSRLDQRW
ncbi:hypothetical protein KSS87_021362 [Heliosperma pusillum]|nr:hypothetical protein KSS87_021362 [Heliosperma pusillum]